MFYGSDNFSVGVGLSIAAPTSHYSSRYMADQTFHTPNFGDEEFDIPPIALPPSHSHESHIQHNMSYPMGMHGVANQGQQQHYASMYLPEHMTTPMTMNSPVSYGGSPPTYTNLSSPHPPSQQSPMGNPQHMMHHPHNQQGARPPPQSLMGANVPPRRSPSNNSTTSPANPETTTSDDSDDSVPHPQGVGVVGAPQGVKRPSPEPDTRSIPPVATVTAAVTTAKKPKAQKKKKKRDPNEPQKPVSAYALFFRDTQAAIKGQNPNASFGEVSKIVASMWDALDADHKNVYKKKTEAAKKEYLKALAAYRASLVSKGAPTESPDGSGMYPPPNFSASMSAPQHYQPPQQQGYYGNQTQQSQQSQQQKKSPQAQQQQQPQQNMPSTPNQQQQLNSNQQQQAGHQMMQHMTSGHHVDSNQYGGMAHNPAYMNQMNDGNHGMGVGRTMHMNTSGGHNQMNPGPGISHLGAEGQNHSQRQMCVRNGCSNVASSPMEADMQGYDEGYCSSQCVVSHCRDVFTNWVSNNQSASSNYGNGMKFTGPGSGGVVGSDGISYVT